MGLSACGNIAFRNVLSRQYQMARSDKCITIDIDLITREPMLNIEGPYAKHRAHVRVRVMGDGVKVAGGWRKFMFPGDVFVAPHGYCGHSGYALVSPDGNEVQLRLQTRLDTGRILDSEINDDYKLSGHEQMPLGLIIMEPTQNLHWRAGSPFEEKTATIRIGSPSELKIVSITPENSHIKADLIPSEDKRVWRLSLLPPDNSLKGFHASIAIDGFVHGEMRRIWVHATVF